MIALGSNFLTKNLTEMEESAESYQTSSVSVWVSESECLETAMASVYRHNGIKRSQVMLTQIATIVTLLY